MRSSVRSRPRPPSLNGSFDSPSASLRVAQDFGWRLRRRQSASSSIPTTSTSSNLNLLTLDRRVPRTRVSALSEAVRSARQLKRLSADFFQVHDCHPYDYDGGADHACQKGSFKKPDS